MWLCACVAYGLDATIASEAERREQAPGSEPCPLVLAKPGLQEQAMALGAAGFFEKPYEADELLDAIKKALDA